MKKILAAERRSWPCWISLIAPPCPISTLPEREGVLILDSQTPNWQILDSFWNCNKIWKQPTCCHGGRFVPFVQWFDGEGSRKQWRVCWGVSELINAKIIRGSRTLTNPWWRQSIWSPSAPTIPPIWTDETSNEFSAICRGKDKKKVYNALALKMDCSTIEIVRKLFETKNIWT